MIFKLTTEQIEEIIELYGGSKQTITIVEKKLNSLGIITNEEDYYEIVCAVIAQKETVNFQKVEGISYGKDMTFDEIIQLELNRKFGNPEDEKEENIGRKYR